MSLTRRAFLFLGSIFLFPVLHTYAKIKRYRTKIDPKTGYYILSPEQIDCIRKRIKLELKLNPFYVWGAAGLKPGAPGDCSGKMYAIFFC